ncbi:FMN-linked oxidoreductase [Dacryopinax primogenitus]|uniref:FMN-linked oxidoreductase n=1 Tax=Dacryopinax primogenitus (strain DJM 731) TaxID=1858805 RepID=M5FVM3_DACPD|nr:FMN-linked oxidoreductase [Dacryopinax primogenitus]EJU01876.1 FMN-linked oxidoreductase [Dacryopinax primogenitus]
MGELSRRLAKTALFTPLKVGNIQLQHRVALAPLTRNRAHPDGTPSEIAITYYSQRASFPGTLLITEGTFIAPEAGGLACAPGIYTEKQIAAWKKITDAVHSRGSFIFCQLWALGRAASGSLLKPHGFDVIGPSAIPIKSPRADQPRALRTEEIPHWTGLYAQAAKNAMAAGFDGVEIHGANGYLVDQFIQDVSNDRTDEYGGSIENRARFALEVIDAITSAVGQERTGIRVSPWSPFQDMRMADPKPTFSYLAQEINSRYPNFAYLHVTEPRVIGSDDCKVPPEENNNFLRQIWRPKVFLDAGGFKEDVADVVPTMGDVIVYGRYFLSNPDLPLRLKEGIPLSKYDRRTFYLVGPDKTEGYIDYPTAEELGASKIPRCDLPRKC